MRWVGQIARWDMITTFWSENLKGNVHSTDLGVDGRIILEWILREWGGVAWTGFVWPRMGASGGLL